MGSQAGPRACSDCGDLLARGLELVSLWDSLATREVDDVEGDQSPWMAKYGGRREDAESATTVLLGALGEHRHDHGLSPGGALSASPTADRLVHELGELALVISSNLTAGPGGCVTCQDFALRRDLGTVIRESIAADMTAGRTAIARARYSSWKAADRTLRAQLRIHRLTAHDADDPTWLAEWGEYADTETATEDEE